MDMKLKNLTINYNDASYPDYDGTPPKTYSAKISLETKIGTTTTKLSQEDIIAIMGIVCNRVCENMKQIAQVTTTNIQNAANGVLIEHQEALPVNVDDNIPF